MLLDTSHKQQETCSPPGKKNMFVQGCGRDMSRLRIGYLPKTELNPDICIFEATSCILIWDYEVFESIWRYVQHLDASMSNYIHKLRHMFGCPCVLDTR